MTTPIKSAMESMKTNEQREEAYANRFFLFLLVMAIIGALSSCGPKKQFKPAEANALSWNKDIKYNEDSTAFRGAATLYRYHTWYLDTVSGFYVLLEW